MDPPTEGRKYPLHMPGPDHKPPVQRYMLRLPDEITQLWTVYIGVQQHNSAGDESKAHSAYTTAIQHINTWIQAQPAPRMAESFTVISGYDIPGTRVWVLYYSNESAFSSHMAALSLSDLHSTLGAGAPSVGLWRELFTTPVSRLETNYSGQDYTPGVSRFPDAATHPHRYSAYWGAARDRIPASAHDAFPRDSTPPPSAPAKTLGTRLVGAAAFDNAVHIRSGQFWERAGERERQTYESELEPALRTGLAYLHEHAATAGNLGLRYLRSLREVEPGVAKEEGGEEEGLRETCGAGFFRNLEDLEAWTQSHESHHAIYNGAMAHGKKFDGKHKFRTWHEVSVMKKGEARFEYVNCTPETGAIPFLPLENEA